MCGSGFTFVEISRKRLILIKIFKQRIKSPSITFNNEDEQRRGSEIIESLIRVPILHLIGHWLKLKLYTCHPSPQIYADRTNSVAT